MSSYRTYRTVAMLYRAYRREERLNVWTLGKRLNNARRASRQKPRNKLRLPMPTWMHNQTNNWGVVLSELCRDAADLIEGKTDADRNS